MSMWCPELLRMPNSRTSENCVIAKFALPHRPGPGGLLQEGHNTSCGCYRFLMYDSSPCASILNLRNAQSRLISPTLIWATARYKQAKARRLISPSDASERG